MIVQFPAASSQQPAGSLVRLLAHFRTLRGEKKKKKKENSKELKVDL